MGLGGADLHALQLARAAGLPVVLHPVIPWAVDQLLDLMVVGISECWAGLGLEVAFTRWSALMPWLSVLGEVAVPVIVIEANDTLAYEVERQRFP